MKKLLLLTWMFVLLSGLVWATGGGEVKDVVTVMTWENGDPNFSVLGPQPVIEYVEDKLNLEIKWQLFSHADRSTAIALVIAAGGELPDLFPTFLGKAYTPRSLAEHGVIIPWSDLMNAGKMPLAKAKFELPRFAGVKHQMTDDETGKIYAMPYTHFNPMNVFSDYVRGDWLETLGLEAPTTVDEYREVLRAFKTQDPNGNGKADEVPWQNWYEGVSWMKMFSRMFGLPTPDYSLSSIDTLYYATVDKQEVVFAPIHDRFKIMLEYLNTLWEEGLINQEQFNMTSPKFSAELQNRRLGASSMWPGSIIGWTRFLKETNPEAYWKSVPYVIDPNIMSEDDRVFAYIGPVHQCWLLAKNGGGTEAAIRLVDYIFGHEEMSVLVDYGIEGVHHEIDNDGNPYFIGEWTEKAKRYDKLGLMFGRLPVEHRALPTRLEIDTSPDYAEHLAYVKVIEKYIKPAMLWKRTQADRALMKDVMLAVQTYVDESITKFVIGTKPFSEWDSYVAEVLRQGGDEIEAVEAMLQRMFESGIQENY